MLIKYERSEDTSCEMYHSLRRLREQRKETTERMAEAWTEEDSGAWKNA